MKTTLGNNTRPPSLRSVEQFTVNILGKNYTFMAWGNSHAIKATSKKSAIDQDVENKKIDHDISKYVYEKNIFENLVHPNLILADGEEPPKSSFINTYLFLEMYGVSRGTTIDVLYQCPNCFDEEKQNYSNFKFSLSEDIHLDDLEEYTKGRTFEIETTSKHNILFAFGEMSDYDLHSKVYEKRYDLTKDDASRLGLEYYFSWIEYIEVDGEKFYMTTEDLTQYVMDELSEDEFSLVISKITEVMPKIRYRKEDVICDQCGDKSIFETHSLPDFSLLVIY